MQRDVEAELLARFVGSHTLPSSYLATARRWFLPLAEELQAAVAGGELKVLGIVGSQGSGKSTLAALLEALLGHVYGLRVASLSLDDFYLTREQRQQLAIKQHPLLATRGVPGTHDIQLAVRSIERLLHDSDDVAVPRFDKARDDRKPNSQWDKLGAPVDLVILEGWCLAATPQTRAELKQALNPLEEEEDSEGRWRHYANQALKNEYPRLFELIDTLVLLKRPVSTVCLNGAKGKSKNYPPRPAVSACRTPSYGDSSSIMNGSPDTA